MDRLETRRTEFQRTQVAKPTNWREESTTSIRKEFRQELVDRKRMMNMTNNENNNENEGIFNDGQDKNVESKKSPPLTSQEVRLHCNGLKSNDDDVILTSLRRLREGLCSEETTSQNTDEILANEGALLLIPFLKHQNDDIVFEAAWCLTNIASGTNEHCEPIVNHGGIQAFIETLKHRKANVREQALWCIGNIAGDRIEYRDALIEYGLLEIIHDQAINADLNHELNQRNTFFKNAAWVTTNILRWKPLPSLVHCKITADIIQIVLNSVHDPECITDSCWAISFLTDGAPECSDAYIRIGYVLDIGLNFQLVNHLKSRRYAIKVPSLRSIGNIVTGTEEQTRNMILAGALPPLAEIIKSEFQFSCALKREAVWAISNIAAGSKLQVSQILMEGIFESLAALLKNGDLDVQKEVVWAISNAISGGTVDHKRHIIDTGFLPSMVQLLSLKNEVKLSTVILECIEHILKYGQDLMNFHNNIEHNEMADLLEVAGGFEQLENIASQSGTHLADKASKIIAQYLEVIEEDEFSLVKNEHEQYLNHQNDNWGNF